MTQGSDPGRDPWRKDNSDPTTAPPAPGPFPAPPYPAQSSPAWAAAPYPPVDPQAPAWARQAHAQGAYDPPTGHVQPMFPPTSQQQPYQQPGYLPPGYAPPGYPAQLPPGAYPPGAYPSGGYPPGYPAGPGGPVKPGVVTAAAVLAYVQAGFLVFGGLVSFAGARVLADLDVSVGGSGLLTVLGVLALVAAGLLIAGGVAIHHRKPGLLIAGCAVSLALSLWWLVLLGQESAGVTMPLLFTVLPIISVSLALGATARAWVRSGAAPR